MGLYIKVLFSTINHVTFMYVTLYQVTEVAGTLHWILQQFGGSSDVSTKI